MDDVPFSPTRAKVPVGIYLAWRVFRKDFGYHEYRNFVLLLTFMAYMCFHASRKPLSIVKGVLDPEASALPKSYNNSMEATPQPQIGWDPFTGDHGEARLGEIDLAFLASYSVGMYFSGNLADRLDLRWFLTWGMIGSGLFVCLFGMGYWLNIHFFSYYFLVQVATGLLSASGWPAVVAVVANWFGKGNRGLIMGVWNAHASVGNIVGSVIAASALQYGWGWSFALPAFAICACALLVFFFLVTEPKQLGLPMPWELDRGVAVNEERTMLLLAEEGSVIENGMHNPELLGMPLSASAATLEMNRPSEEMSKGLGSLKAPSSGIEPNAVAIRFMDAWFIPGVAFFAFSLFFVKLVAYTFLYWLPFYIRHTEIGGTFLSDKVAGYLSAIFDIGGVLGGILAGHLSDKYKVQATISLILVACAVPTLYLFRVFGGVSLAHAVGLMILSGVFVNGPYALITTAVSADLGNHSSLQGNAKALATVTAIIDGTGSVGAAVGPFLTGYLAIKSWTAVFVMLVVSLMIAGLLLMKLVLLEMKVKLQNHSVTSAIQLHELREISL